MALNQNTVQQVNSRLGLNPGNEVADTLNKAISQYEKTRSVTITPAAPVSTSRSISIQVNDSAGTAVTAIHNLTLRVYADAAGAAYASTGGSTGIVQGASGKIVTQVTKKVFDARTTSAGLLVVTWTDNASEVAYLGVSVNNGPEAFSAALTI